MYTPLTESGRNYRTIGYWFASGVWYQQRKAHDWVADHASEFGDYCAYRRDEYVNGITSYLPSVLGLWEEFGRDIVFAPPTEDTRASADRCERAGLDPTGRFAP
jgi:hypothetical protein